MANRNRRSATFPRAMPALARAQSITRRAAHLGFRLARHRSRSGAKWKKRSRELKNAVESGDKARTGRRAGRSAFPLVNLARFLDVEAEEVLAQTIDRFTRRFHHIETKLQKADKSFDESSLEEMDLIWEEAKTLEAQGKLPR